VTGSRSAFKRWLHT